MSPFSGKPKLAAKESKIKHKNFPFEYDEQSPAAEIFPNLHFQTKKKIFQQGSIGIFGPGWKI